MHQTMTDNRIKNIVGGGMAGWMAAAVFAKVFEGAYSIRLIESQKIGDYQVSAA